MASTTLRFLGAFVLLSSTLSAAACGSDVSGGAGESDEDGGGGNPTSCPATPPSCEGGIAPQCAEGEWFCPTNCPASEPVPGGACAEGLSCSYGEDLDCGPAARHYDCVAGAWSEAKANRCMPEPECPLEAPQPGTDCDAWADGLTCRYDSLTDCGPGTLEYTCEGGQWTGPMVPRCGLPPCRDAATQDLCENWGCRWLEPSCGTDELVTLAEAGCFEAAPCEQEGCLFEDEECVSVQVRPECASEEDGCDDVCGEPASVCLPVSAQGAE